MMKKLHMRRDSSDAGYKGEGKVAMVLISQQNGVDKIFVLQMMTSLDSANERRTVLFMETGPGISRVYDVMIPQDTWESSCVSTAR